MLLPLAALAVLHLLAAAHLGLLLLHIMCIHLHREPLAMLLPCRAFVLCQHLDMTTL